MMTEMGLIGDKQGNSSDDDSILYVDRDFGEGVDP